jgi:hypothetical protein
VDAFQEAFGGVADAFVTRMELSDTDGDGLPDLWELFGFATASGEFVDLPAMGADPDRKDIFVEIDYMTGQKPTQDALEYVVAAFAEQDITLHWMLDDEIPFTEVLGEQTPQGSYAWSGTTSGVVYFQDLKDAHFTASLAPVARYCIFARKIGFGDQTASGIARPGSPGEFSGSDFIVSLGGVGVGGVGSVAQQAGTFMHELGHTLGLQHGGGDDVDRKPNYLSVMNYHFQLQGLVCAGSEPCFDFSRVALPDLDENSLLEADGIGSDDPGLGTKMGKGVTARVINDASGAIDWDNDGTTDTVAYALDLNGDGAPAPPLAAGSVFHGFNDWEAIIFKGGAIGAAGASPPPPVVESEPPPEIDAEIFATLGPPAPSELNGNAADSQNVVTWKPVGAAASYNVYRTANGELEFMGNRTQSNFHDTTAVDGVEYLYSVASVDASGVEGPSASVTVRTR